MVIQEFSHYPKLLTHVKKRLEHHSEVYAKQAFSEVQALLRKEDRPFTLNDHYLIAGVRHRDQTKQQQIQDWDDSGAKEMLALVQSYFKVAFKRYVDLL